MKAKTDAGTAEDPRAFDKLLVARSGPGGAAATAALAPTPVHQRRILNRFSFFFFDCDFPFLVISIADQRLPGQLLQAQHSNNNNLTNNLFCIHLDFCFYKKNRK